MINEILTVKVTRPFVHPDLMQVLASPSYISILNFESGYQQTEMELDLKEKTASIIPLISAIGDNAFWTYARLLLIQMLHELITTYFLVYLGARLKHNPSSIWYF